MQEARAGEKNQQKHCPWGVQFCCVRIVGQSLEHTNEQVLEDVGLVWSLFQEVESDGVFITVGTKDQEVSPPLAGNNAHRLGIPRVCSGLTPTHAHALFCVEQSSHKTPGIIDLVTEPWLLVTLLLQEHQR